MPNGRKRRAAQPNNKGRSRTSRFVRLDHKLLYSGAYRALSLTARALLTELIMLYNGENNGSLYLSVREATMRLGLADAKAAMNAFDELQEMGFIECTVPAHFSVKAADHSRARCWRLTFEAGPGRKPPSLAIYETLPEPKTKAYKRMERGQRALKTYLKAKTSGRLPDVESRTMSGFWPDAKELAVSDSTTLNDRIGRKPPKLVVRESRAHIATPEVPGSKLHSWWEPDWSKSFAAMAYSRAIELQANQIFAA